MHKDAPVSVLMPVFNGEEFLKEAIGSILRQTHEDFVFIIVDDGSTDRSWTIIQQFDDPRIQAFRRPHEGMVRALNFGLSVSQSDWILRIDQDDIAFCDRLEVQLAYVGDKPRIAVLGGQVIEINERGEELIRSNVPEFHNKIVDNILNFKGPFFAHSSALIKRSYLEQAGVYRERFDFADDIDLWLRMSEYGELRCLQRPVAFLRRHSGSMSRDAKNGPVIVGLIARLSYLYRTRSWEDFDTLSDKEWAEFSREVEAICSSFSVFSARLSYKRIKENLKYFPGIRFYLSPHNIITFARLVCQEPRLLSDLLSRRSRIQRAFRELRKHYDVI
ncbi:MAG TPA: hypothetical protein DEP84_07270 [Chloroflexi bacterium]|nr:hypothetical protein [Chloroflexota bacterium]